MSGLGIAASSIPGSDGTIFGCFATKGKQKGDLRVVAKAKCRKRERSIAFNQQGVPGQQGPPGPAGSDAQFNGAGAGGALAGTYPNPALAAPEPIHRVGSSGEPAFEDGSSNSLMGTAPAGFYKDPLGRVHLSGTVNVAAEGDVFRLAPAYRPSGQVCGSAPAFTAGTAYTTNRVCVLASTGEVRNSSGTGIKFVELGGSPSDPDGFARSSGPRKRGREIALGRPGSEDLTAHFGSPHHHLRLADSTNTRAKELAVGGAASGTIVTADEQSAGRGRGDRVWTAPAGSALLYSAILRPLDLAHLLLPLAVPVAVCEACEALAPVECRLKWPNDVWLGERKLAGVLIEARPPEWAVIGVGINLSIEPDQFPRDLRWPAASLGHGVGPERMRAALDEALGRWVEGEPDAVRAEFSRRDALRGREIGWEEPASGAGGRERSGVATGIDERGNLLVRADDGVTHALGSGEVHLQLR